MFGLCSTMLCPLSARSRYRGTRPAPCPTWKHTLVSGHQKDSSFGTTSSLATLPRGRNRKQEAITIPQTPTTTLGWLCPRIGPEIFTRVIPAVPAIQRLHGPRIKQQWRQHRRTSPTCRLNNEHTMNTNSSRLFKYFHHIWIGTSPLGGYSLRSEAASTNLISASFQTSSLRTTKSTKIPEHMLVPLVLWWRAWKSNHLASTRETNRPVASCDGCTWPFFKLPILHLGLLYSGTHFIVDTGAEVSVILPSRSECHWNKDSKLTLQAVNGSLIITFGTRSLTLNLDL